MQQQSRYRRATNAGANSVITPNAPEEVFQPSSRVLFQGRRIGCIHWIKSSEQNMLDKLEEG